MVGRTDCAMLCTHYPIADKVQCNREIFCPYIDLTVHPSVHLSIQYRWLGELGAPEVNVGSL